MGGLLDRRRGHLVQHLDGVEEAVGGGDREGAVDPDRRPERGYGHLEHPFPVVSEVHAYEQKLALSFGAATVPDGQTVVVIQSDSIPTNATFSNDSPKIWNWFSAFKTLSRTIPSSSTPPSRKRKLPSGNSAHCTSVGNASSAPADWEPNTWPVPVDGPSR